MSKEEIRNLLGGYATGTLTEAERKALFEAALHDDELFAAVGAEQYLKDVLDEPRARAELLEAVSPTRRESKRWWIAALGATGLAVAIIIPMAHRPPMEKTVLLARAKPDVALRAPAQPDLQKFASERPAQALPPATHSEPRPSAPMAHSSPSAPPRPEKLSEPVKASSPANEARAAKEPQAPERLALPSSTFLPAADQMVSNAQPIRIFSEPQASSPGSPSTPARVAAVPAPPPEPPASGSTPDGVQVSAVLMEQRESSAKVRLAASADGFVRVLSAMPSKKPLFSSAITAGSPVEAQLSVDGGEEALTITYYHSRRQNSPVVGQQGLLVAARTAGRRAVAPKVADSSRVSKSAANSSAAQSENDGPDAPSIVTFQLRLKK